MRGERERPTKSCLDLERVRECEESNYKQTSSEERERPTKSCLDLERVRECEESNYKR